MQVTSGRWLPRSSLTLADTSSQSPTRSARTLFLAWLSLVLCCLLLSLPGVHSLKIHPKPCNNALGEEGTCMFVWECIKTEGKHLGTCVDGFLFGSCCGHNDTSNSIEPPFVSRPPPPPQSPSSSSPSFSSSSSASPWPSSSSSSHHHFSPAWTSQVSSLSPPTSKPTQPPYHSTYQSYPSKPTSPPTPPPTTTPSPTTTTTTTTTTKSPAHSQPQKPWPTAASPVHAPVSGHPWQSQPATSAAPPATATVMHTFRPPIFSIFGTHRPPPGTVFLKPTRPTRPSFRPPMPVRPTTSIFQPFSPRPPPTPPPTTTTTSTTTTSTTTTTTPAPYRPPPTLPPVQQSTYLTQQSQQQQHMTTTNQIQGSSYPTKRPMQPMGKVVCGAPPLHPQSKVVGGKNAAFGSWPWQVSVRRTSFFGFSSTHRCGGAIINSEWIATAGHCVDDLLLSQIRIRVGEYDFASVMEPYPFLERGAKRKVVHPHYNFFTYENDLALVQLDEPLDFQPHISPICLPPDNIELVGRNATVTGWGRLSEGGVLPSVLQETKVPIVSNDRCKSMFLSAGRHEYIPEIFMCAGYEDGGRDSCQGDSGGPLQVQGDDGKWFLAGIISWGIGCAEPNLPGVCTRISKFKNWIVSTVT